MMALDIDYINVVRIGGGKKLHRIKTSFSLWTTECGIGFTYRPFEIQQYRYLKKRYDKCKKCFGRR